MQNQPLSMWNSFQYNQGVKKNMIFIETRECFSTSASAALTCRISNMSSMIRACLCWLAWHLCAYSLCMWNKESSERPDKGEKVRSKKVTDWQQREADLFGLQASLCFMHMSHTCHGLSCCSWTQWWMQHISKRNKHICSSLNCLRRLFSSYGNRLINVCKKEKYTVKLMLSTLCVKKMWLYKKKSPQ